MRKEHQKKKEDENGEKKETKSEGKEQKLGTSAAQKRGFGGESEWEGEGFEGEDRGLWASSEQKQARGRRVPRAQKSSDNFDSKDQENSVADVTDSFTEDRPLSKKINTADNFDLNKQSNTKDDKKTDQTKKLAAKGTSRDSDYYDRYDGQLDDEEDGSIWAGGLSRLDSRFDHHLRHQEASDSIAHMLKTLSGQIREKTNRDKREMLEMKEAELEVEYERARQRERDW